MNAVLLGAAVATLTTAAVIAFVSLIEQASDRLDDAMADILDSPLEIDVDGLNLLDAAELLTIETPDQILWSRP